MRRISALSLLVVGFSLWAGAALAEDTIDTWNLTYWRTVSTSHQMVPSADPAVFFAAAEGSPLQIGLQGGRQWEFASPSALKLKRIWTDRSDGQVLFAAATEPGLFRSDDRGATWQKLLAGEPRVVLQGNDPAFFLVATQGQLWASTDHGRTFVARTHPEPLLWVEAAALQTSNGHIFLLLFKTCGIDCGDAKLLRSTDNGNNWQQISTPEIPSAKATLLAHPSNPVRLYLVIQGDGITEVQRSQDGGLTWQSTAAKAFADGEYAAFTHSRWPDRLFVNDGDTFWRSDDAGITFADVTPANTKARGMAINGAGRILIAALRNSEPWAQSFYESNDGFVSHSAIGGTGYAGGSTNTLSSTPSPGVYYVVSSDDNNYVWRTTDHGRSWQRRAELQDSSSIAVDPTDADTVIAGVFGDPHTALPEVLVRSVDGGATFQPVYTANVPSSYVLRVRSGMYQGQVVWLALLYEGGSRYILRSTDLGANWSKSLLPETPRDLMVDGNAIYITGQNDGFYRSFDGGQTFNKLPNPVERPVAAGGGVLAAVDYQNARLRVSTDRGFTWTVRPLPRGVQEVDTFYADHLGRLFLAFNGNTLLRSDDQGRSFTALTKGLYNARIAQLTVDPFDAHRMLARTWEHGVLTATFGDSPSLLLAEGRFEIKLNWHSPANMSGVGSPNWLTGDTGLFWLFSRERSEVAVKMLDGRAINGRFWLFVASLSDVEYDIEVTDLYTGDQRSYHKPQGLMDSFADTEILPIGAPQPSLNLAPGPVLLPRPDETSVGLHNRFDVSIHWKDPLGQEGEAIGFDLSEETAAFYFFEQKNIEVFVNLIDGRSLNGKYWVFFGGLSNVQYTVKVYDRQTGATRTYNNAQGQFGSVADTSAFPG